MSLLEAVIPNLTLDSSNFTSPYVETIDESPDSPDADFIATTTTTLAASIRVAFGTPSRPVQSGSNLQKFRAWVKRTNATSVPAPMMRFELWENGSLVRSGSDQNVTSSSGVLLSFTWSKSELSDSTGAGVECKLVTTPGGVSADVGVSIGALEWTAQLAVTPSTAIVALSAPSVAARFFIHPTPAIMRLSAVRCSTRRGTKRTFSPEPTTILLDVTTYSVRVHQKAKPTPATITITAQGASKVKTVARLLPVDLRLFILPGKGARTALPSFVLLTLSAPSPGLKIGRKALLTAASMTLSVPTFRVYSLFGVDTRSSRIVTRVRRGDKLRITAQRLSGADTLRTVKDGVSLSVVLMEDPR